MALRSMYRTNEIVNFRCTYGKGVGKILKIKCDKGNFVYFIQYLDNYFWKGPKRNLWIKEKNVIELH